MLRDKETRSQLKLLKRFRAEPEALAAYDPPKVLERRGEYLLPLSDQGKTSRCASEATCAEVERQDWAQNGRLFQQDAAEVYRLSLISEGSTDPNSGTTLLTPVDVMADMGIIERVQDMRVVMDMTGAELRLALCRLRHHYNCVLLGFDISEGWSSATKDGWLDTSKTRRLGGHGVPFCDYRSPDRGNYLSVPNSWGPDYAWNGFLRIPWEIVSEQFLYGIGMNIIVKKNG